jgi:hypothetical protein
MRLLDELDRSAFWIPLGGAESCAEVAEEVRRPYLVYKLDHVCGPPLSRFEFREYVGTRCENESMDEGGRNHGGAQAALLQLSAGAHVIGSRGDHSANEGATAHSVVGMVWGA